MEIALCRNVIRGRNLETPPRQLSALAGNTACFVWNEH